MQLVNFVDGGECHLGRVELLGGHGHRSQGGPYGGVLRGRRMDGVFQDTFSFVKCVEL